MKAKLLERFEATARGVVEYFEDGDGLTQYDHCFESDLENLTCNVCGIAQLIVFCGDSHAKHYELSRVENWLKGNLHIVDQFRDAIDGIESEHGTVAEPVYSGNEYYRSQFSVSGFTLPEYDVIWDDFKQYPRIAEWLTDNSSEIGAYDGSLVVWLSGQIEYIANESFRRLCHNFMRKYENEY